MRIISGRFKSRQLKATPPAGIRPTSDKLRETIFNILGPTVEGATFLDGCAGMGGIGIEAISRGASMVYFVEQSRKGCRIIRENLELLEVEAGYKILEMDLAKGLGVCVRDGVQFDLAFIDPPYEAEPLYQTALTKTPLAQTGLLILEHSKRIELPEESGNLRRVRSLVQGDAALAFYRPEVS